MSIILWFLYHGAIGNKADKTVYWNVTETKHSSRERDEESKSNKIYIYEERTNRDKHKAGKWGKKGLEWEIKSESETERYRKREWDRVSEIQKERMR